MNGVVNGVFICNNQRLDKINEKILDRNNTSQSLNMTFSPRPAVTRQVLMPMLDCRQPTGVPCMQTPLYNVETVFNPGNSAPFSGYQNKIDDESKLKNIVFPLQKAPQSKFIPSFDSDLYNNDYLTKTAHPVSMTHQLLFQEERFSDFNPNCLNLGKHLFNNSTRAQVRDL